MNYSIGSLQEEINNTPRNLMRGGIYTIGSKISEPLSYLIIKYVTNFYKISEKQLLLLLIQNECPLYLSGDTLTLGGHLVGLNVLL